MDQASLIEQLRIERAPEQPPRRIWPWTLGVAVGVVAIGGALVAFLPRAVPIQIAVAEPVAGAAVGPSSILDASGYVVARRQATVSSKITGKVVAVAIEEGQRVERDEIIARLDDTNARAAVAQARAELAQARANLGAAKAAFENAQPTFKRNEQQLARAVISAQNVRRRAWCSGVSRSVATNEVFFLSSPAASRRARRPTHWRRPERDAAAPPIARGSSHQASR